MPNPICSWDFLPEQVRNHLCEQIGHIDEGTYKVDEEIARVAKDSFEWNRCNDLESIICPSLSWIWVDKSKEELHDQASRLLMKGNEQEACKVIAEGANTLHLLSDVRPDGDELPLFTLAAYNAQRVSLSYMALLFDNPKERAQWASLALVRARDLWTMRLLVNMGGTVGKTIK